MGQWSGVPLERLWSLSVAEKTAQGRMAALYKERDEISYEVPRLGT